jgi:hypothetical protein
MPRIAEIRVGYVAIPIVTPFDCTVFFLFVDSRFLSSHNLWVIRLPQ